MSSSRRQHSADTRTRIIDAAFQLIVESGMPAATSRRIAEVAGLSLGTVSYHFASITDIIQAAFMSMSTRYLPRFEPDWKPRPRSTTPARPSST